MDRNSAAQSAWCPELDLQRTRSTLARDGGGTTDRHEGDRRREKRKRFKKARDRRHRPHSHRRGAVLPSTSMALGHVFTRRIQRFLFIGGDQRAQRRRRGVLQKKEIRATAAGYRRARPSTAHQVLGGVVARDRVASPADNRRRARETRRARRGQLGVRAPRG